MTPEEAGGDQAVDVSKDKDCGILKTIIREGTGDASPSVGDTVYVHYIGTLEDGTQFDSSRDRGEQFNFTLGKGQVIKAWDHGVATMKKGEVCKLVCQAKYAYGETGSPPKIPPNATLNFSVELFSWEGEDISPDRDKTIRRSIQKEGEKYTMPKDGATVEFHLVGRHDSRIFLEKDFNYILGESFDSGLPDGIDKALKSFKKKERSLIQLKPKWGYGASGNDEYNIPPDAELEFEIELKDFKNPKESWEMNEDEKLENAEKLKAQGTEFFQAGNYKMAIMKYAKIIELLQFETHMSGEKKEKRHQLYLAARLNSALCFLKSNDPVECRKHCDIALQEDPKSVKAIYRRGLAFQMSTDYEEAMKDFCRVLELEEKNKAAMLGIRECKAKIKEQTQKEKKLYANMFEKFAKEDYKGWTECNNSQQGSNTNAIALKPGRSSIRTREKEEIQRKAREKCTSGEKESGTITEPPMDDIETAVVDAAKPDEAPQSMET